MIQILSFILLLVFVIWLIKLYSVPFNKQRFVHFKFKGHRYDYMLSKEMYLLIFTICTAPFFLTSFSLIKYGIWFLLLLLLIINKRITLTFDIIIYSYIAFFIWLVISCIFYSTAQWDGFLLLIKYLLPLLYLWLGYTSFKQDISFIIFLRSIFLGMVIYAFFIGGFSSTFMPWLYNTSIGVQFTRYAAFADFLTSLLVVPLVLFFLTKKKVYLLGIAWCILSTILESVRTGLGGMFLVLVFASFFKYKFKSLPYIGIAVALFIGVILFVPEVNQKMFGKDKAGTVTAQDILKEDALSMDNIQTNGRSSLWDLVLNKFYEPNKLTGAGLGVAMRYVKDRARKLHVQELIHSDYVQILSETGLIGLGLEIFFAIVVLYKVFVKLFSFKRISIYTKYTGIMAVSSLAGIAFAMGFNNVVSMSMTSLINPFIFIGMFIKSTDLDKK